MTPEKQYIQDDQRSRSYKMYLDAINEEGPSRYSYYNREEYKVAHNRIQALTSDEVSTFETNILANEDWKDFSPNKGWMGEFLSAEIDLFYLDSEGQILQYSSIDEDFDGYGTRQGVAVAGYLVEHEVSYGGEGQGDAYWRVVKVSKDGEPTTYWRYDGYYASHAGGEYENVSQVTPKEKTITVWG